MTRDAASGLVNNLQQQVSGLRKLLDQKDKELAQCQKERRLALDAANIAQKDALAAQEALADALRQVRQLEDHYGVR